MISWRKITQLWIYLSWAVFSVFAEMPGKGRIIVLADKITNEVSRLTTGACLEDVNHEVYGGIYSQMIYGESFEEPPLQTPIEGFVSDEIKNKVSGNAIHNWQIKNGILCAPAGDGPKLIAQNTSIREGSISGEIYFDEGEEGSAGFILKVREFGPGADNFKGYAIALDPSAQELSLGKHQHNWTPLKQVRCSIKPENWILLKVILTANKITVLVDNRKYIEYEDKDSPLTDGMVGFRTWRRTAKFRSFSIQTSEGKRPLPFKYVQNPHNSETFQVSRMWTGYSAGDVQGTLTIETEYPLTGRQAQRITLQSGSGSIGIANSGLNRRGMYFQKDKNYEGVLWARAEKPVSVQLSLEDQNGQTVYGKKTISIDNPKWQKVEFSLISSGEDEYGRFSISLREPGSVVIGYAFLQPGEWGRFKGLPVRLDVAEALIKQNLTILRYGGCMVNAPEYRWKKMTGPRGLRPPYKGWWYPYSSNGWGIIDFIDFCEAAGFECVPAFNIAEHPEDMADFVDYIHGGPETEWGKRRIENGHPEPYQIKYIQIGNEESVDDHYAEQFKSIASAIWSRDPRIIPVVGDFHYREHITDPFNFGGAPRIRTLSAHQEILRFAKQNNKPVWFDVHFWNDQPRDLDRIEKEMGFRSFIEALEKINDGAEFKVCVFEENANNHRLKRGLAHAHAINEIQRYEYEMPILCAANCLQPNEHNDNGWDQGLLFLSQSKVWGQPSYYVTQMIAGNYQPLCVESYVSSYFNSLDVTACKSRDGKALSLRVVNLDCWDMETEIDLMRYTPSQSHAEVIQIRGDLDDANTPENPLKIAPVKRRIALEEKNERIRYVFPAYSFTIINFN